MEMHRLPRSIRQVIVLGTDECGGPVPQTVYSRRAPRRKVSAPLRPTEKAVRRLARATSAWANSYASRHDASNAKKRDGWLRDYNWNVYKATKTGVKQLKLDRS